MSEAGPAISVLLVGDPHADAFAHAALAGRVVRDGSDDIGAVGNASGIPDP